MQTDPQYLETENAKLRRLLKLLIHVASTAQGAQDRGYFLSRCLEEICQTYNWTYAQAWMVSEEQKVITCDSSAFFASGMFDELRQDSLERRFTKGVGLPGRVWGLRVPLYIGDLSKESGMNFPRQNIVMKFELNSAFAFPLFNGSVCTGVLEFYANSFPRLDSEEERFFEKLGSFIGTYLMQKETQARLLLSEMRHGFILDHSFNAFIAMSATGTILHWNKRAEEFFGWKSGEVVDKLLSEVLIPQKFRDAHNQGLLRYLATGREMVFDKAIRTDALCKSGSTIPIEMTIFPVPIRNELIFGAFIKDLSRQTQEALDLH
ncbi:MAG: PAS domain S-box protein [Candidatus Obscuribacterales bacterium]|nr:PAS domain S-box protein [Candidatus Obscuribacterales bacterium]